MNNWQQFVVTEKRNLAYNGVGWAERITNRLVEQKYMFGENPKCLISIGTSYLLMAYNACSKKIYCTLIKFRTIYLPKVAYKAETHFVCRPTFIIKAWLYCHTLRYIGYGLRGKS